MQNARKEIEAIIPKDIKCATIDLVITNWESKDCGSYEEEDHISVNLPVGYTQEEYDNFMKKLDVEYNAGYGMQELFGTIWLKDGTWFDRGEYDGSEWWIYQQCPEIPDHLEQPLKLDENDLFIKYREGWTE